MKTKIIKQLPNAIIILSGVWYITETLKSPKALLLFVCGLIFKRQIDKRLIDPVLDEKHWTQIHAVGYANHTHTRLSPNKCPECAVA